MSEPFDQEDSSENENPDDLQAFLRKFMSQDGPLTPEQIAAAAGLPKDPKALNDLLAQIQSALATPAGGGSVNWTLATQKAREIARQGGQGILESQRKDIADAVKIGSLWLNQATALAELSTEPKLLSRELWTADAMPLFQALAQPVAESMSNALAANLESNIPEEFAKSMKSAGGLMRSVGAAMFAMQLGEAIGKLSSEVLTGGDIGLPIFQDQRAAFVPQNLTSFVDSFESDRDQTYIYLAVREMVHARLFKNSKWLRDYVVQQITKYSSGITIDSEKLAGLAEEFDPSDPSSLQAALESGALISEKSEDQKVALQRVETILALIEGWVEVVTEAATKLLPKSQAIGEAVRRRRATGGPAEKTFTTLVGLELRPRRQREATEMWRRITTEVGVAKRDGLWSHPDMLPTSADIDDPTLLIAKLRSETGAIDAIDQMLIDLLNGEGPVDSAE